MSVDGNGRAISRLVEYLTGADCLETKTGKNGRKILKNVNEPVELI